MMTMIVRNAINNNNKKKKDKQNGDCTKAVQ